MVDKDIIDLFRVAPKTKVNLAAYDPDWVGDERMKELGEEETRKRALALLERERGVLAEVQARLYASDAYAVLVILQGMTLSGVDEVVKHVMTGVNPQGCQAHRFPKPSAEELDHDFLWRYSKALPERGRIGIFNGSYYDLVVSARVNPDMLAQERLPQFMNHRAAESTERTEKIEKTEKKADVNQLFWKDRYRSINNFESHLERNGIVVLKFFLNISREEQRRRILEMIEDPVKRWRYTGSEMGEQKAWNQYLNVYGEALSATSTAWAPWFVIPANHYWAANALAADILTDAIMALGVKYPQASEEKRKELEEARARLMNDG